MQSITSFICSIIKPFVSQQDVASRDETKIVVKGKLPKKSGAPVVKANGFIADSIWDFLNCDSQEPPPSDFCIDNNDCETGERCKEGSCLTDPTHCSNSGCDENYECNEETGACNFVPECISHSDCDQIDAGELCLQRLCTKPEYCVPIAPTVGCAAGWTCVDGDCTKLDCSIVDSGNKDVCCTTPLAFNENEVQCCSAYPALPGC